MRWRLACKDAVEFGVPNSDHLVFHGLPGALNSAGTVLKGCLNVCSPACDAMRHIADEPRSHSALELPGCSWAAAVPCTRSWAPVMIACRRTHVLPAEIESTGGALVGPIALGGNVSRRRYCWIDKKVPKKIVFRDKTICRHRGMTAFADAGKPFRVFSGSCSNNPRIRNVCSLLQAMIYRHFRCIIHI